MDEVYFEKLLLKYITLVCYQEGIDFLGPRNRLDFISQYDWEVLQGMSMRVTADWAELTRPL